MKISYSGASQYKDCPKKFFLKKKYKLKYQASAFAFGAAIEDGVTALLQGQSFQEAQDVFGTNWHTRPENRWEGATQIVDNPDVFYYNSDYDKNLIADKDSDELVKSVQKAMKKDEKVKEDDLEAYNKIMWNSLLKRGYYMLEAFQRDILPYVKEVISVQREISLPNDSGDEVVGFIDYILKLEIDGEEKTAIIDLKTAGRPYTGHDLDTSDQLRIYAAALGINTIGYIILLKNLEYVTFCDKCGHERENNRLKNCSEDKCKGKYTIVSPKGKTQVLIKDISNDDLEDTADDFSEVLVAMKNGVEWKNSKSCFNYGTKCEYYEHCWNRRSLDEMDHLEEK